MLGMGAIAAAPACSSSAKEEKSDGAGDVAVTPRVKDVAALGAMKAHPVACRDEGACAVGSHCDTKASRCTWECLATSDCGGHGACSMDGRCVSREQLAAGHFGASAGAVVGGMHPMAHVNEACTFTDECIDSAYCDDATQVCKTDCTSNATCGGGGTCVHGRCVTPAKNVPRLDVSSAIVRVAASNPASAPDATQAVRVVLSLQTADASLATKGAQSLPVTLSPTSAVQIQCADTSTLPTTGYGGACVVDGWQFRALSGGGARADKTLWVRLNAGDASDAKIAVSSSATSVNVSTISVADPATLHAPPPPEGEYTGTVTFEGSGIAGAANGAPTLEDQVVLVKAVRNASGILLLDDTKQLSPSGTLFYALSGPAGYSDVFAGTLATSFMVGDSAKDTGAIGGLIAVDKSLPLTYQDGKLTGRITFGDLRKARFDLVRTGDSTRAACTTSAACDTTSTCDLHAHVCVPKALAFVPPATSVGNSIAGTRYAAWASAASAALSSASSGYTPSSLVDFAEQVSCFDGTSALNASSPKLTSTVLPASGELKCANAAPGPIPLYTYQDLNPNDGTTADTLYQACLAELRTNAPASSSPASVFGTSAFAAAPKCVHLGRFAAAIAASKTNDPALFNDLLRQWVSLHSFLAQQGRVEWQEANVLAVSQDPTDANKAAGAPVVLYQLLEQLERGWDVILSKDVLSAMIGTPRAVVLNPDYRVSHSPSPASLNPSHEQGIGLPVALMEAATQHLEVLAVLVQNLSADAYAWCQGGGASDAHDTIQERIGSTLRYVMAIEGYATTMRKNAGTTVPAWDARWTAAETQYLGARQRVATLANALLGCANPLGIDDSSLPLYFTDPHGRSSRYFASSDYMTTLATGKIAEANTALTAAKNAWLAARTDAFQDNANEQQFQQRLDDLLSSLEKPIEEACGGGFNARPYIDGTATTPLDVSSCHIDTTRADCAGSRDASCYHGSLGEAALEVLAAKDDVKLAFSAWSDSQSSYETQFNYCRNVIDKDNATDTGLDTAHNKHMADLRSSKLIADEIGIAADAAGACASGAASSFGAACGIAAVGGVAKGLSAKYQKDMEDCDADHQLEMANRSRLEKSEECYHEADMRAVGIYTAQQTIDRRGLDAQLALLKFRDLQRNVEQQLSEARGQYQREKGRKLPSVAHHHWLSDEVNTFTYEMDLARKYTYLALQAAEYDTQRSYPYRARIVGARSPLQLSQVIDDINSNHNTRTVDGRQPGPTDSPDFRVLSLRDEILNLRANMASSGVNDGEIYDPYGATNYRLRDRLRDPSSAIYDKNGTYLGQGVSFTLNAPSIKAAAGRDVPKGEWNFPGADEMCGERLWGISATIGGDGVATTFNGRLQIFKRNTFESQWCTPSAHDSAFQVGRYRPTGYIFGIEPGTSAVNDETQSFLPAAMTTPYNLARSDMEKPVSPAPLVEDLAGRGLCGDYVLVIPKSILSDPAFHIEALEDILLRFEFYRVSFGSL